MSLFGKWYSRAYDLLYADKDYEGEAAYIDRLIQSLNPGSDRLLEYGSGTGKHAEILSRKRYMVHGIELSESMLSIAKLKENEDRLRFTQGDIRTFRLNESFDVVIAMFHVMNYMVSNEDLVKTLKNAAFHLHKGGIMLFDSWYGPAVLTERPSVRVKRLEDDELQVIRISEPAMGINENAVDVKYHVIARKKKTGVTKDWHETHRMRYLFTPEVEMLFKEAGFHLEHCSEFMTGSVPGSSTWNVLYAGRKL